MDDLSRFVPHIVFFGLVLAFYLGFISGHRRFKFCDCRNCKPERGAR